MPADTVWCKYHCLDTVWCNTDKTTSIFDACRFYFFVIFLIKYLTDKHLVLVGFVL